MIEKTFKIINKLGLHARAAAKFVAHAGRYESEITITKGNQTVNGKSIMGVMMLAASFGSEILIRAQGVDEADALTDLEKLIADRFGEAQ
jgi:phosphocarrier protein HPr